MLLWSAPCSTSARRVAITASGFFGKSANCGSGAKPMTNHFTCPTPMRLALALVVAVAGCSSLGLKPDRDLELSGRVERPWIPPASVSVATSRLEKAYALDETKAPQALRGQVYDLAGLVDLALRTNPQTQRAWYAAQAADAQFGQSRAANYPKITATGDGGDLTLPIPFPGQTLVIRNEAFLPPIKVSYDLLDFRRTPAPEHRAREQLIPTQFAFHRAIPDCLV